MSDWEDEDGFAVVAKKIPTSWDDDVIDNVPDAWDAEEVKPEKLKSKPTPVEKLSLTERIKLKEEQRRKEKEEKLKREEESRAQEESLSELQREKMAEESELSLLEDTFGPPPATMSRDNKDSIDMSEPKSKDDFNELNDRLKQKISQFEKLPHYSAFAERLARDIVTEVDIDTLRSLNTAISALISEKQKLIKGKVKKKTKGGKLMVERDNAFNFDEEDAAIELDEYDDFM